MSETRTIKETHKPCMRCGGSGKLDVLRSELVMCSSCGGAGSVITKRVVTYTEPVSPQTEARP